MIKVCELFAGVGGFRLGLEKSSNDYKFVWANQWEPGKKSQHAYENNSEFVFFNTAILNQYTGKIFC